MQFTLTSSGLVNLAEVATDALLIPPVERIVAGPINPNAPRRAAVTFVAGAVLVAIMLRIPLVGLPVFPDEGGYLLVARYWHSGGPGLYGDLWVDRPPLLILFWRLADALGGIEAGRVLALLAVAALVVSAGSAGWSISGLRGARWACVTAAALSVSPLLHAEEVDGELLAVPLVMMACALTLLARQQPNFGARTAAYGTLAGVTAASAFLVKQNFIEGLVFIAVMLAGSWWQGHITKTFALQLSRWSAVGALIPVSLTIGWAITRSAGLGTLYSTLFAFRSAASEVIGSHSLSAPEHRSWHLMGLLVLSGLLPLALCFLGFALTALRRKDPVATAITLMLLIEGASIAVGGSYWSHYLIALIPSVAVGAAWLAIQPRRVSRILVALLAATNLMAAGSYLVYAHTGGTEASVASYLARAHAAGDTGFVAYGHPNILESSGLTPVYPQLWSLPLRVLDPDLTHLTRQLRGPRAPTWFVQGSSLNSWDIDRLGTLARTRDSRYRLVATICDVPIYLLKGVSRSDPTMAGTCSTTP